MSDKPRLQASVTVQTSDGPRVLASTSAAHYELTIVELPEDKRLPFVQIHLGDSIEVCGHRYRLIAAKDGSAVFAPVSATAEQVAIAVAAV